jgi:hypothetical protein
MNKNKYVLYLFLLAILSCKQMSLTEENNYSYSMDNLSLNNTTEHRILCLNFNFPTKNDVNTINIVNWRECDGYVEVSITALQGAYLWAQYNNKYQEDLNYKACGETIPTYTPAIRNFMKLTGINPSMKWDFMWSHYYIIKRKIGNGPWLTIYIDTLGTDNQIHRNPPDTVFTDTTVNLKTIGEYVYYSIFSKLGDNDINLSPGKTLVWPEIPIIDANK